MRLAVVAVQRAAQAPVTLSANVSGGASEQLPLCGARSLLLVLSVSRLSRRSRLCNEVRDVPVVVVGSNKLGCTGHGDREAAEDDGKSAA